MEFQITGQPGQLFHAREWSPAGEPIGLILLIHGLSDHGGRYLHVGSFFAESGYVLIIPDLRGNGRSFGKRGHLPSYQSAMDDLCLFEEVARKRHPGIPVVLYGHSMGGNLVLNYLIRMQPDVAAAVVTSPWLRLNLKPPLFKVVLANLMNRLFPSLTQPDGIIPTHLSHDASVAHQYTTDPLVHNRISVRTFLEISRAGEFAMHHAGEIKCPLLLMHGTGDLLTSFSASQEFSGSVTSKHIFKAWEGLFHELHNESEKEAVLAFIREWLDKTENGEHVKIIG